MTAAILETTKRIISDKAGIDLEKIHADTVLSSLDIQSLDLAEIIFELEDEFDIEIDMSAAEAWDNLKTVSDIADSVAALVAKGS